MQVDRNKAFLKGTISLSLSVIITKILGVGFKVPLSYVLGDEGMGYFNTAYAIYGFFYILCTAGVPKSLTLVLSEHRSVSHPNASDEDVLKCGLKLFLKIGIVSTILNLICAPALARTIGNDKALYSIIAVAPSILFVSMGGVLRGYLNSCERLTAIAISQLAEGAVKLVLGLLLALIGVRLGCSTHVISALAISGITAGSAISFLYMLICTFFRKRQFNKRQNGDVNAKNIRNKIVKNALPIAISSSLLNLSATLDLTMIIKRLVDSGVSAGYANSIYGNYTTLAVPMFNLVISVLSPIATSCMPRLSELNLRGTRSEFSVTLNRLLLVTLVISVPASLAFYFYSFDLLDVLFSVQSSALGADMLVCLSFGLCFLSSLTVINTALESQGRIGATVFSLLFGCVVKLFASYALIGKEAIGILGAPLGTVLSYAVSLCVSLLVLERQGVRTFALLKAVALYLIGFICFYPPYKIIYSTSVIGGSFLSMAFSLAISIFVYLLLLSLIYIFIARRGALKCTKNGLKPYRKGRN